MKRLAWIQPKERGKRKSYNAILIIRYAAYNNARPTLTYANEIWTVNKNHKQKFTAMEMTFLRKIKWDRETKENIRKIVEHRYV